MFNCPRRFTTIEPPGDRRRVGHLLDEDPNSELTAELALLELPLAGLAAPLPVLPVPPAPESLTEAAAIVPLEPVTPWMTTESPGCKELFETPRLLVTLVADESVTLTVLPEASVM